jgi:hypothetical protein
MPRTLDQGKKGRELFDPWLALHRGNLNGTPLDECFRRCMDHGAASFPPFAERRIRSLTECASQESILRPATGPEFESIQG